MSNFFSITKMENRRVEQALSGVFVSMGEKRMWGKV
jgi:hypothetical protein